MRLKIYRILDHGSVVRHENLNRLGTIQHNGFECKMLLR